MSSLSSYLDDAAVESDDIASLERYLNAGPFDYVDVATQQAHDAALGKWPLLAEIAAWRNAGERGAQ